MKTLIVYAGKYGCTESCAINLKDKLQGDITVVDANKHKVPMVDSYDNIIIGSSVYVGQINKKIKAFIANNLSKLKSKKIGLFLCCGFMEKYEETLDQAFPKKLLDNAVAVECFGGELNTEKMSFLHKKICQVLEKEIDTSQIKMMLENIQKLADKFKV